MGGDRLLSLTLWRQGTVVGDRRDRGRWSVLFTSGKYGDGDTTGLVSQEWLMKNGTTIDVKEYSYDDRGNIVSVVAGGKTTTYVYDDKNQLVRENNQALGKSYTYSYDSNGNLTSKKTYAYTTGALGSIISSQPFSYWDEGWGDLLSAFEGVEFTYDEIGNPLIYFNGEIYNFTWQKGRQLSSSTLLGNTYTYKYNQDGIRIEKTVGDKTHVYTLNGTRIEREIIKTGNTVVKDIYYYYDASGIISSAKILIHSGSTVTEYNLVFLTNMQGDVYEIYLDDGTKIASYNYDAWGNITTTYITTNTTLRQLADEAPFRYRGYYFDSETGFYYLNTRYYDPKICRFINADDISYLGANGDLQAYNLYAYCSNNPVMLADYGGNDPVTAAACVAYGLMVAALFCCVVYLIVDSVSEESSSGSSSALDIAPSVDVNRKPSADVFQNKEIDETLKDKEESIPIPKSVTRKTQKIIFPNNPDFFNPIGLVRVDRPGTKNGKIISWMNPVNNMEVFRWDENINYPNGPHYHINSPVYMGKHFYFGDEVPEPYASMYFRGGW